MLSTNRETCGINTVMIFTDFHILFFFKNKLISYLLVFYQITMHLFFLGIDTQAGITRTDNMPQVAR